MELRIQGELNKLNEVELAYVMERSKVDTNAEAYRAAGISRPTFYRWEDSRRTYLNELATEIKRQYIWRAMQRIEESVEKAVDVKISGLDDENSRVKQKVATEIIDRAVGKPVERQRVDQTTEHSGKVQIVHVVRFLPPHEPSDPES